MLHGRSVSSGSSPNFPICRPSLRRRGDPGRRDGVEKRCGGFSLDTKRFVETRGEPATAQAWLAGQPQIAVVARDRGGGYALAAAKALPHAPQRPDRWHLLENCS